MDTKEALEWAFASDWGTDWSKDCQAMVQLGEEVLRLKDQPKKEDFDVARLKRLANLVGPEKAMPDDDTISGCAGTVLGMIARKVEGLKAEVQGRKQEAVRFTGKIAELERERGELRERLHDSQHVSGAAIGHQGSLLAGAIGEAESLRRRVADLERKCGKLVRGRGEVVMHYKIMKRNAEVASAQVDQLRESLQEMTRDRNETKDALRGLVEEVLRRVQ